MVFAVLRHPHVDGLLAFHVVRTSRDNNHVFPLAIYPKSEFDPDLMVKSLINRRDLTFKCYIASDHILAKKQYASEKDIILPETFLPFEALKASSDYGWGHPLVSYSSLGTKTLSLYTFVLCTRAHKNHSVHCCR